MEGKNNEPICLFHVDRMDLHSCSHRIHLVHPDIDVLAAGSSDTPYWSPHYVTMCSTNFGM